MFGTLVTWPMGGSMFCGGPDAAMVGQTDGDHGAGAGAGADRMDGD